MRPLICQSPPYTAVSLVYSLPALHRVSFIFILFFFAHSHSLCSPTVNRQLYVGPWSDILISNLFYRLNAGRSFLTWHSLSTAPTDHLDSTPTRNSSACCSTCATKTAAVSLTCAALEPPSTSSTASATGSTTSTARKLTSGTNGKSITLTHAALFIDYLWKYWFLMICCAGFTWTSWLTSRILPSQSKLKGNFADWRKTGLIFWFFLFRLPPFSSSSSVIFFSIFSFHVLFFFSFLACVRASPSPHYSSFKKKTRFCTYPLHRGRELRSADGNL